MNDDQNGLSLEDDKISKISSALQKGGEQEFKGALANVGIEIMPQVAGDIDTSENQTSEVPKPEPEEFTPKVETVATVPTVAEETTQEETLAEEVPKENTNSIIQSLRTYERDVADSIRAGETTMSINLAEQKRRLEQNRSGGAGGGFSAEQSASEKVARGSLLFIMSGILIAAALGTLAVTFYFKNRQVAPSKVEMQTIISIDDSKEVVLTSLSKEIVEELVQKATQENGGNGTLTQIDLKKERLINTFAEAEPITPEEFFGALAKSAPSALGRALGENWLLGFYSLPKVDPFINEPFVIFELETFDSAYSAMLAWEPKILGDIGKIFKTTSPGAIVFSNAVPRDKFEDLIVKSRDTRVLRDSNGKILILYSFIDTGHLVIATHEETFREIVARYLSRGLVR